MTTIVTRVYDTEQKATSAATAAGAKIGADAVDVVKDAAALRTAITKGGVGGDAAESMAAMIPDGGAIVVARAPWGTAARATSALDDAGPVATELPKLYVSDSASGRAESIIPGNRKYLTADGDASRVKDPTPFSTFFGMRVLSDRKPKDVLMRGNTHIMPWKPLSDWKLGAPLITEDTAVFSKRLGWETLKERPATQPLLERDKTPFSTALGLDTLMR
ncbi:MAG: hypothetical protein AAF968_09370 [Pseudomonadota bacterium]